MEDWTQMSGVVVYYDACPLVAIYIIVVGYQVSAFHFKITQIKWHLQVSDFLMKCSDLSARHYVIFRSPWYQNFPNWGYQFAFINENWMLKFMSNEPILTSTTPTVTSQRDFEYCPLYSCFHVGFLWEQVLRPKSSEKMCIS